MKNITIILPLFFAPIHLEAQFIKERSISGQIGYGITSPYYSSAEIVAGGLFLQGEYILKAASWFELRPYAGLILTSSDGKDINKDLTNEKATSKALLIGGKGRVRAPIPWVAPYIEIGIGSSIGKFETFTNFTNIEKNGFIYHIPVSLGLELGRSHGVDLGLAYYYQPTVEQFSGAFAFGITVPLKNKTLN